MLFFLILIKIIYIESNKILLVDKLFNKYETKSVFFFDCQNYDEDTFYYRGRPINIKDIIDSNNINNIKTYKYVLIPEFKYLDNVTLFPKSTVFFYLTKMIENSIADYCIIPIDYDLEKYKSFYYFIIGNELDKKTEELLQSIIITLFVSLWIFAIIFGIRLCYIKKISQIYVYNLICNIFASLFLSIMSCLYINALLLTHLLYTLYKSVLFINLMFLIDGFTILEQGINNRALIRKILCFFLYSSLLTIILLYINYFLPSINNTVWLILKSIIEHLLLLFHIIKAVRIKFMPLYYQYQLEKRIKRPLAIICKIKLLVYIKIIILGLIYCISFILLSLIELLSSFINYAELFYYNYYVNIILEVFLFFVYGIIFFPSDVPSFFFSPIRYNYNEFTIVGFDKENNESNIGILTKKVLTNKYAKNRRPIIFISPFSNDKNLFKNLYLGTVEIDNQK